METISDAKKRGWRRKAMLGERGFSLASIARQIGVTRAAVSAVINEERKSWRLRKKIHDLSGVPYIELWNEEMPKWMKDAFYSSSDEENL